MSVYSPPLENILQFNTSLFQSASTSLTLADADLRYCKNNNGYITGSLNVIGPIYGTVLNIDSALVLDNNASIRIGYNNSAKNYIDLAFNYVLSGSDTNYLSIGAMNSFVNNTIGINTINPYSSMDINNATGKNLRLIYNDATGSPAKYTDLLTNTNGDLTITNQRYTDISNHNGIDKGLALGGVLITATAADINNIAGISASLALISGITPGTLLPSKALTYDANSMINSKLFLNHVSGDNLRLIYNNSVKYVDFSANSAGNLIISPAGFKLGLNTTTPSTALEINDALGNCLRLTYNDSNGSATVYGDITISSGGNIILHPSSDVVQIDDSHLYLQSADTHILTSTSKANLYDLLIHRQSAVSPLNAGIAFAVSVANPAGLVPDASIIFIDTAATKGSMLFSTKISGAVCDERMRIDDTGFIGIGTTLPGKHCEINNSTGQCLRLSYNAPTGTATYFTDFLMTSAGTLTITNQQYTNISNHNGSTLGLQLGGTLITSTAAKLNYTNIATLGTAEASKVLTLDASAKLNSGIVELNATTLKCTNLYINSTQITTTPAVINSLTGLTASATELNYNDITTLGLVQSSKTITVAADGWITGRLMTINNGFGFSHLSAVGGTELITVSNGLVGAIGTYTNHPFQFYQNNSYRMALQTTGSLFNIGSTAGQSYYVGNWSAAGYWGFGPDSALSATIGAHICTSLGVYTSYAPMKMSKLYIGSSGDTDTSRFITCLDAAMANSSARFICFGKANSAKNQAEISYYHVLDGSNTNSIALGFHSVEAVRILASGFTGIGTNNPIKKLSVNDASGGSIRLVYNNTLGTETVFNDFLLTSSGDLTITNQRYTNISNHNGSTLGLQLGGTLITATATEINVLDGITASTAELNYTDITTLGVAQASKCITADANIDVSTIRNMRLTGTLGVGTTTPDLACEINHATGQCLRLTYNDNNGSAGFWSNLTTSASGSLNLDSTTHRVKIGNGTIAVANLTITGDTGTVNSTRQTPLRLFESGGEGLDFSCTSTYAHIQTITNADLRLGINGAYNSKLTIARATGYVGINTDSPAYQFQVAGTSKVSKLLVGTSTDDSRMLSILDSTMISGSIRYITLGYANSDRNQAEISYEHILDSSNGNSLIFGFHSMECMRLKSNGYFGIGTNNPVIGLHVNAYASFNFTNGYGYLNSSGNTGTQSGTSNYSGYFDKRCAAQEFNAISDRREKENFKQIKYKKSIDFINNCEPKKYNYIGENTQNYGYVAQDILKAGFDNLINLAPSDLEEEIDDDGFVSPKGAKFVLQYNSIIPLLHTVIKQQQKDINDIRNMLFDSQLKAHAESESAAERAKLYEIQTEKNRAEIQQLKSQIKNIVFIIEEINKKS